SKGDPIVVGRWRIVSTHDFHLARLAYRLDRSSRVLMNLVFDINGVEIFEIVAGAVVYEVFYEIEPYTQELIKGGKFSELTATVRTIQNLPVDVRAYMDITGIRFPGASESIDPGIPYVGGKSVNIAI
ncbi:hypothetical protein HYV71_00120, partial [Candidatus Uhrbacteria bacterium]|nr:hypothetical protein [Candidatus Uhrbacteria bacterium]